MVCGVPARHVEFGFVHQIGVAGRLTRSGYIVQNCGHWAKVRWLLKKGQLYFIPHWGLPLGYRFPSRGLICADEGGVHLLRRRRALLGFVQQDHMESVV